MKKLTHIYENEQGITCFDQYFDYLNCIKAEMPARLVAFATDRRRYQINGESTLHDAWLKSMSVSKQYAEGAAVISVVQVCLLLATHRTEVILNYSGVVAVSCSFEPDRWPSQPVDLLVHEFSKVEKGMFRHFMQFDRSVWLEVKFTEFSFQEGPGDIVS
ncbi:MULTISPECIES: hypothetical protein [Methylocaldum]|jgi:hypothetical protein|uniref:hypothetical protein n=1 Tax=Methylocaldum sp. RMAD-M TaxID=2806557 RepID=UPI000A322538|nr:hypothetical protein [Methylocaldum sp. RMAD-M]MBP1152169.1 hypothetical protein [Methylocaldum sp. RMAD-M]MVF24467.1 hypothetical protein [Methylocaldum sp. BRCS4]